MRRISATTPQGAGHGVIAMAPASLPGIPDSAIIRRGESTVTVRFAPKIRPTNNKEQLGTSLG